MDALALPPPCQEFCDHHSLVDAGLHSDLWLQQQFEKIEDRIARILRELHLLDEKHTDEYVQTWRARLTNHSATDIATRCLDTLELAIIMCKLEHAILRDTCKLASQIRHFRTLFNKISHAGVCD